MNSRWLSLAALAVLWAPLAPAAQMNSDCHALKLVAATGVPHGSVRTYEFGGSCNIIVNLSTGPRVERIVPAEATATWDATKKELSESFRVLSEFSGGARVHAESGNPLTGQLWTGKGKTIPWVVHPKPVTSRFACSDDPLVTGAACGLLEHSNASGFDAFSNPAKQQSRPLLKGKTTLAEATQKSAEAAPILGIVPVPPKQPQGPGSPLPWKGIAPKQGPVEFEAEALYRHGKVQHSDGAVAVQSMMAYGTGWSGNEQLFWSGGAPGAAMDLMAKVPRDGRYRVEIGLTRAPDYGDLAIHVGGQASASGFSGYRSAVSISGLMDAGVFQLKAGEQRVRLMVIGKSTASTGYLVGVDRIVLTPVQSGD